MAESELGIEELAKYPFLKEAGERVKRLNIDLEELAREDYRRVVDRARQRIIEAINQGRVSNDMAEADIEILSFPTALLLAKATKLEHLMSRYSHAESVRVEKFLETESKQIITYIFKNVIGVEVQDVMIGIGYERFDFKIGVKDYLARAVHFHKPEWKLVNRNLIGGCVYLKTHDLVRLIREEIRKLIYERIRGLAVPKLPQGLRSIVEEIIVIAPKPVEIKEEMKGPESYPPCVTTMLDWNVKGQNVPHFGRFLLTTYLLKAGKTVDDLIQLFRSSPDFSERIARYQVEHIAGLKGGRVKYSVPSCATVATHGICFRNEQCGDITHPLQFGRRKTREIKVKRRWMKRQRS